MATDGAFVAFAVGAAISLGSSWLLVSRLERVGERLGLSEALLGLVAALAADAPEITAAITALIRHERTIGAGVVIGSNVFNLAALLGLGAIVAGRIGLHRRVIELGGVVGIWLAVVCLIVVDGIISAIVGLVLALVLFVPFVFVLAGRRSHLLHLPLSRRQVRWLTAAVNEEELELVVAIRPRRGGPRDVVEAAVALAVVVGASVAMEQGASALGQHFAVAAIVVGGLVLAAVTSLPNAVAAVYLARKGRGAAAFSTALNSNSLNVLAGLLIPASLIGLARPSAQGLLVAASYLALTVLTLTLAYVDRGLRRSAGACIVACYVVFVIWLLTIS